MKTSMIGVDLATKAIQVCHALVLVGKGLCRSLIIACLTLIKRYKI